MGNCELEISWQEELAEPITIIVYGLFNQRISLQDENSPTITELF